jgi:hypothetical protein
MLLATSTHIYILFAYEKNLQIFSKKKFFLSKCNAISVIYSLQTWQWHFSVTTRSLPVWLNSLRNQWTTRALQTSNEETNHTRILRPCWNRMYLSSSQNTLTHLINIRFSLSSSTRLPILSFFHVYIHSLFVSVLSTMYSFLTCMYRVSHYLPNPSFL